MPERLSQMTFLFEPLRWVRWLGLWTVLAAWVGRGLSPALRGLAPEAVTRPVELLAGVMSQGLLLALVAALVMLTASMLRLPGLPLSYRMAVTALGGLALGLSVPAGMVKLAPEFSVSLGVVAAFSALAGAGRAVGTRATRVLGVLLVLAAIGALTRQTAWWMAMVGGARGMLRLAVASRWVAGGALLLQIAMVAVALLWLATRRRHLLSLSTTLCSALAMVVSWYAERLESGQLPVWKAALARAAILPLSAPPPPSPLGVRVFLGVVSLLLGLVAVMHRREAPAVVGAMALVLAAGFDLDMPLCALSIAVASLAATLAAHDPETVRHPVRHDLQG